MKILFVCRIYGRVAPFISEQMEALQYLGNEVRYVTAQKGGLAGYFELYRNLMQVIRDEQPDIVHAHYGICGLIANLQHQVPVVVTYLGSDINDSRLRPISILSILMSRYNLFMSKRQIAKVQRCAKPKKTEILRYGILSDLFIQKDKTLARKEIGLEIDKKFVLFSSAFTRIGKEFNLAKTVVAIVDKRRREAGMSGVELLPLTGGYTKEEMVSLMNAVDAAIVTSKSEGSPQFTKEVMACGTPIVSVDVGDVAEQVKGLDGCYISMTRDAKELAGLLEKALTFGKTNGHQHIKDMHLDNVQVAERLVEIYKSVLKN